MSFLGSFFAISLGASLGACLRWSLSLTLDHYFVRLPLGTLLANLLGGVLIGFALAFFAHYPNLPAHWRLFAVTGFLGGLTTFSTFSAESLGLLQNGHWFMAGAHTLLHVFGSLFCAMLGFALFRMFSSS